MSLTAGAVAIADDGTETIAENPRNTQLRAMRDELERSSVSALLEGKRKHARTANGIAGGLVPYLTVNAAIAVPIAKDAIDPGVPSAARSFGGTIA